MIKISFIYFDVGGVAIQDYSGTNQWEMMLRDLGITDDLKPKFEEIWNEHSSRHCIDYDIEQMVPIMRKRLGLEIPPNYSFVQDFVNRYAPNPSIWPVIEYAQSKYKTGLLTNMYPKLLSTIYARADLHLDWPWDVIVDSSVVKADKPDPKIFEIAESKVDCPPSEILFVENTQKHIDVAKSHGWQTFLFDHNDSKAASEKLRQYIQFSDK
jgi:HAD superfamily hydrolase (TIGR01509 family)